MSIEMKVPEVGESITEVYIGEWHRSSGDRVEQDEELVELESDKATFDAPAPVSGVLTRILKQAGETAKVGEVIAYIDESDDETEEESEPPKESKPSRPSKSKQPEQSETKSPEKDRKDQRDAKEDKEKEEKSSRQSDATGEPGREVETIPMSPIRRRIAKRLVAAQQNAALLTTFNEIDLSAVQELRRRHREAFEKKYEIKLGFMSFFVKAAIDALKQYPQLNAEIQESDIVYHNYFDIGVAIGTDEGLVVPVLRNAERMSFSEIETAIDDFARRAHEGALSVEELQGGTFTISNGGIYGSLLSTPIVNPPQSGVLGMHTIQDRPVALDGQVVIRPMMYVALSYDHRIVDGREAVSCLRRIKETIEEPARMLFEA